MFKEDEYEFFMHRNPDVPISLIEYEAMIQEFDRKWVPAKLYLEAILGIIEVLNSAKLAPHWYEPIEIARDFRALSQTIEYLGERYYGDINIRIRFI